MLDVPGFRPPTRRPPTRRSPTRFARGVLGPRVFPGTLVPGALVPGALVPGALVAAALVAGAPFVSSTTLGPATASAQDSDGDTQAREHFVVGRRYFEQARYPEAAQEFSEAYRLSG